MTLRVGRDLVFAPQMGGTVRSDLMFAWPTPTRSLPVHRQVLGGSREGYRVMFALVREW
jgi:hypothetical protein